jgi:GAF domain-containing protein
LFEETERQLQQNQQYVEHMRRSAEEIERLNRRLTGRFWSEYLEYKTDAAFGLTMDLVKNQAQPEAVWTPTLEEAARHNHLVQRMINGRPVVAVPLRVRGQVIGAMEFELGPDGRLSPEDVNLLQEIGERLGAAAETTRLFERNQQIAQREALVNTIATRLQSANSVEMTLDTAARSLKETLNVSRVAIRLGRPGGYDEKENGA